MPVFETTIQSVTQRIVNTRNGPAPVYDIVDGSGNKWGTFKQPIANEANRLVGQQVLLTGRVEKNDKGYENFMIDDVQASNGATSSSAIPTFNPNPVAQAQQAQAAGPAPIPVHNPDNDAPTEKDRRIARQTAAKVSANISDGDPHAFWMNLDPLLHFFLTGEKPSEFTTQPEGDYAYAQNDPGREAPIPSSDDDIPF